MTNARACVQSAPCRPPTAACSRCTSRCRVLGVPPAAATAQPVAMCGSAAERPTHRNRRRHAPSAACDGPLHSPRQSCAAVGRQVGACTAFNAYNAHNVPIMPIMLCRPGRSMRHAQRIAQLEIRRAVRARGGAAALWRQGRGAFLFVPLFPIIRTLCVRACLRVCACVCLQVMHSLLCVGACACACA